MINITDKSKCCGCTACANICPKKAITMQPDSMGFKYPYVDESKCIDCGLCQKICSFNEEYDTNSNLKHIQAYAVRHKNIHEIETSRSGAAFIAISDYVLNRDGIVYGVGYKEHFVVTHKRATTKEECNEFKGSKYVQSNLEGVFASIKEDLQRNRLVLFSGTPCQTAGLNSFVGKQLRKKLILVDIVCHGVPAPNIWKDYIIYLENKYNKKILKVNFRDKSKIGWAGHIESFTFDNGEKIESRIFTHLFYQHIMLRPSCGKCHYTNLSRPSDMTIADFWGWEKVSKNFNQDNKGCSLLFINTSQGAKIFSEISNKIHYIPTPIKHCIQPNLLHPTEINKKSEEFIQTYTKYGFSKILKKYSIVGVRYKWKNQVNKAINKLKSVLKKL